MNKKSKLHFEIKEFKEEAKTFKAYATTYNNVDTDGDIIMPGSFSEVIEEMKSSKKFPKILYQHRSGEIAAVTTDFYEDEKGVVIEGKFIDTTISRNAYIEVKEGAISDVSIGFSIGDYTINNGNRFITKVSKWFETSFVTWPANEEANIIDVKNYDGTIRSIERLLRDVAGFSQKQAKTIVSGGIKALSESTISSLRDVKGLETLDVKSILETGYKKSQENASPNTEEIKAIEELLQIMR